MGNTKGKPVNTSDYREGPKARLEREREELEAVGSYLTEAMNRAYLAGVAIDYSEVEADSLSRRSYPLGYTGVLSTAGGRCVEMDGLYLRPESGELVLIDATNEVGWVIPDDEARVLLDARRPGRDKSFREELLSHSRKSSEKLGVWRLFETVAERWMRGGETPTLIKQPGAGVEEWARENGLEWSREVTAFADPIQTSRCLYRRVRDGGYLLSPLHPDLGRASDEALGVYRIPESEELVSLMTVIERL